MNKKGMEMSINAIVAIILAIMVFGAGLIIFKDVVFRGQKLNSLVNEQYKQLAIKGADNGHPVFIYPKVVKVKNDDFEVVYLAIRNIFSQSVNFSFGVSVNNDSIPQGVIQILNNESILFKAHEVKSYPVIIHVSEFPSSDSTLKVVVSYRLNGVVSNYKNNLIYVHRR